MPSGACSWSMRRVPPRCGVPPGRSTAPHVPDCVPAIFVLVFAEPPQPTRAVAAAAAQSSHADLRTNDIGCVGLILFPFPRLSLNEIQSAILKMSLQVL